MSTNKNTASEVRFVCSHCLTCVRFVCEVRRLAVARMRNGGWTVLDGESICDRCVAEDLKEAMRKSTAPAANAAVPVSSRYPRSPSTDDLETVRPMQVAS